VGVVWDGSWGWKRKALGVIASKKETGKKKENGGRR